MKEEGEVPMIYTPKCPRCGISLECSEIFYGGMDEDCVYYDFDGYCPHCLAEYEWEEVFKLEEVHDLMKIEKA